LLTAGEDLAAADFADTARELKATDFDDVAALLAALFTAFTADAAAGDLLAALAAPVAAAPAVALPRV
jgi:hypothetical protein